MGNNYLLILSIVLIVVSIVNISEVFIKIADFKKTTTGNAFAYVNLTIGSYIALEITRDTINFGSGSVNSSYANSTLYTSRDISFVERGTWNGNNASAIIVKNIGNVNCSLYIKSDKNAHDLFGSASSSNEQYMINVTNKDSGSCYGGNALGVWIDVNKSYVKYCSHMGPLEDSNEIYIDLLLTVPADSNNIGNLSDILTITAMSSG